MSFGSPPVGHHIALVDSQIFVRALFLNHSIITTRRHCLIFRPHFIIAGAFAFQPGISLHSRSVH